MYLSRLANTGIEESEFYVRRGSDADMPNCTRYAYDRSKEASENINLQIARAKSGFGNAKTWYNTTTHPKGSELREGAVAVFDGTYGHVAFVERVIDDKHAIVSQSNYNANKSFRNWWYWEKKKYELEVGRATVPGTGKLLGFIYVPINDKRVSRDKTVDQVIIDGEAVNVRKTASLNGEKHVGLYCPIGTFNVLEWSENDGYTWAKLDADTWVACGGWATVCKADDKTEKLKKENAVLKDKLERIKAIINE